MTDSNTSFSHLPIPIFCKGHFRFPQFPGQSHERTRENRLDRKSHASRLSADASGLTTAWKARRDARSEESVPLVPDEIPLLLEIEPESDLDFLRTLFRFEVISESEQGYVIVAAPDVNLTDFLETVRRFVSSEWGSGNTAKLYSLHSDDDRLRQVLSPELYARWPGLRDEETLEIEAGISCLGTEVIPEPPIQQEADTDSSHETRLARWRQRRAGESDADFDSRMKSPPQRRTRESDEHFQKRWQRWELNRDLVYRNLERLQMERESAVERFVNGYGGSIADMYQEGGTNLTEWPDSFTVRMQISGKGLRDFVMNFPYVFEVSDPEDTELPNMGISDVQATPDAVSLLPPDEFAPAVCVIDSGIQEQHKLLAPAVDSAASKCFLPGASPMDVADYVRAGGHGTRVSGAVLYGESIPTSGVYQLPCWIQNARVLDENCRLPTTVFPSRYLEMVVNRFRNSDKRTRIFNHSISGRAPSRIRHMSAWAAAIDKLSYERDVLFIQSVGNVATSDETPASPGIREHLAAGREYPDYLLEASCRVANPAQSLQAVTVGSISYDHHTDGTAVSFGGKDRPSCFSKTGLGIWNTIKPDVVEYGGELLRNGTTPPDIVHHPDACPHLVRSTLYPPGPAHSRDEIGTSFAAPKVAHLAARLQSVLPEEPTLLYRALIAQSARWPTWAASVGSRQESLTVLRHIGYGVPSLERAVTNNKFRITLITSGARSLFGGEAEVFQVPIPEELRRSSDSYRIRIEVTLSYAAAPRRTRRRVRGYLATWLTWLSSNRGESRESFISRALVDEDEAPRDGEGSIPWFIQDRSTTGRVADVRRGDGTLQKDWALIHSFELPPDFCIAVVGHKGWSRDPRMAAKYSLAVTFEAVDADVEVYEPVRAAVEALVSVQTRPEVQIALS